MKQLWIIFISLFLMIGCGRDKIIHAPNYYQYHTYAPVKNYLGYKLYPVYLDASFSREEVITFQKVVAEWNAVLNGYARIQILNTFDDTKEEQIKFIKDKIQKTDEGIIIFGMSENNPLIKDQVFDKSGNRDDRLAFVSTLGDDGHIMVVIRDRIGNRNLHKILLHEFGHALGAHHVETFNLMYYGYGPNQSDCVDKITAAQVAQANDLDLSKLNYCATPNFE